MDKGLGVWRGCWGGEKGMMGGGLEDGMMGGSLCWTAGWLAVCGCEFGGAEVGVLVCVCVCTHLHICLHVSKNMHILICQ